MVQSREAFDVLVELALRSRKTAKGLPAQKDIKPHWSGVGFSLLNCRLVSPMGAVTEMLDVPPFTRLPGVQNWVKGVANVRGRLLPLFDLASFFGERLSGPRKQRRILILETDTLYSGLIVDQVFGMQHFLVDTFSEDVENAPLPLQPFLLGSYRHDGSIWWVFNPVRLVDDPQFANAAQT